MVDCILYLMNQIKKQSVIKCKGKIKAEFQDVISIATFTYTSCRHAAAYVW